MIISNIYLLFSLVYSQFLVAVTLWAEVRRVEVAVGLKLQACSLTHSRLLRSGRGEVEVCRFLVLFHFLFECDTYIWLGKA